MVAAASEFVYERGITDRVATAVDAKVPEHQVPLPHLPIGFLDSGGVAPLVADRLESVEDGPGAALKIFD